MGSERAYATARELVNALITTNKLRGSTPTVYEYTPEFHVVRFDFDDGREKQIRPISFDGNGWIAKDPPGKLPLYHVAQLANADRVYVSEGEKTTELLRDLGLYATTSSHGSGSAYRSDWTPLTGKDVVLLPDEDMPGEKYIGAVHRRLCELNPTPAMHLVYLPGLRAGEDVEQWLERLGDGIDAVAAIEELVEQSPSVPVKRANPNGPYTEMWLAEKFVDQHGDNVRYSCALGWFAWNGGPWKQDVTGEIHRRIKTTIRNLHREVADIENETRRAELSDFARKSERNARVVATAALAQFELPVPVRVDQLDSHPWLLCTPEGTVDLQTGRTRPNRPADLLTKSTAVEAKVGVDAPKWQAFLDDIFNGDEELIGFVQRAFGSMLSGAIREHVLHILFGKGANGKSTLVEVVKTILGDYATVAAPQLLMLKHESHPAELADLRGMRMVACVESGEGRRLDEERVKQLCGGDTIKARKMYHDFFEFIPTHTLLLATNHKPEVKGRDVAIWRRLRLWPFNVTVEPDRQDLTLKEKLLTEGSAILGWLVQGCLDWQEHGLAEPESVLIGTEGYRAEQDTIASFLEECCVSGSDKRVQAKVLHEAYRNWSGSKMSLRKFGICLREADYEMSDRSTDGKRFWMNVDLLAENAQNDLMM